MTLTIVQAWISIGLSVVTMLSVVIGVLKMMSQNATEWKMRELRIQIIESDVTALKNAASDLTGIRVKVAEVATEMSRIRDRLDRFLDGPRTNASA